MKRKLCLLLTLLLLFSLFPMQALAADAPAYYLYTGKAIARLEVSSFKDALDAAYGQALIVDGGTVTLNGNLEVLDTFLIFNNATVNMKKGNIRFEYYPLLTGDSQYTVSSGAKFYYGTKDNYWYPFIGSGNDFDYSLKSGSMNVNNTGGKNALNLNQPGKATATVDKLISAGVPPETMALSGKAVINDTAYLGNGDTFVVGKGATLTVKNLFNIYNGTLINNGTLLVEGDAALLLSQDYDQNANFPDISKYNLDDENDVQRFMKNLEDAFRRAARFNAGKAGNRFDNMGVLKGDGYLYVSANNQVTNYGSITTDIFNLGKVVNNGGEMDCFVTGLNVTSAKNSAVKTVSFQIVSEGLGYVTTVTAGNTLGKPTKKLSEVTKVFNVWFTDKERTKPFYIKIQTIYEDVILYNEFF